HDEIEAPPADLIDVGAVEERIERSLSQQIAADEARVADERGAHGSNRVNGSTDATDIGSIPALHICSPQTTRGGHPSRWDARSSAGAPAPGSTRRRVPRPRTRRRRGACASPTLPARLAGPWAASLPFALPRRGSCARCRASPSPRMLLPSESVAPDRA